MKPEWLNKWLLLAMIWFLASIYFLFLASGNNPLPIAHFDKISHFGLFFGQFWLLAKICLQSNITIPLRSYLASALLWACISELIQTQLPRRNGDILDAIADLLGALCALWLARKIQLVRRNLLGEFHHGK